MEQRLSIRVLEENAPLLFERDEGVRIGIDGDIRDVGISVSDPRYAQIGKLQRKLERETKRPFFYGWNFEFKYTKAELSDARAFELDVVEVAETAGENWGTLYDDSKACKRCGAGGIQVGPLVLNTRYIHKKKDVLRTWTNEVIVSRRTMDLFRRYRISGVSFKPVNSANNSKLKLTEWFQLIVTFVGALIIPPTRVGNDPFDDDRRNKYRCSTGHLLGLSLLSEIWIDACSVTKADIIATQQYIGVRRDNSRPWQSLIVSPRVRELVIKEKIKGCGFKVVHLG